MTESKNINAHLADGGTDAVRGPTSRTAWIPHTPGPWRCIEVEFGKYQTGEVAFVVSSSAAPMVASVTNCALIAAAPELLAACQLLAAYQAAIDSDDPASRPLEAYSTAMDAAYAAIAKAEGQA